MVKRDIGTIGSMGSCGFKLKTGRATPTGQDNGAILSNISQVTKTDTVIIGNGPSALALSYLLHGNEPWYISSDPHPDLVLHKKLLKKVGITPIYERVQDVPLYDVLQSPKDYADLTCHFPAASSMSYSTAALPLNTLLDTLLRPLADIDLEESKSRISWRKAATEVVPHVILGEETKAGGQWAGDEVWFGDEEDEESDNGLKTLSYADLLSLPGYSFSDHYRSKYYKEMDTYYRPTRRLVADYYAAYPRKAGIEDVLYPGTSVTNVERMEDASGFNFLVSIKLKNKTESILSDPTAAPAHVIRCRNVVLATGIFSHRLLPPPVYAPFLESAPEATKSPLRNPQALNVAIRKEDEKTAELPLLVVGSGYTAADAILCNQRKRPVVHIYRWDPEERPSPLRGCHPQAYPGYADVYQHMKEAALNKVTTDIWYKGFPNGNVLETTSGGLIKISWKSDHNQEEMSTIKVADIKVCIGRRGRLDYLAPVLCEEIGIKNLECYSADPAAKPNETSLPITRISTRRYSAKSRRPMLHPTTSNTAGKVWVQHNSLRGKVEENIEVAPNVFINHLESNSTVGIVGNLSCGVGYFIGLRARS
ncbi:hypothetical protein H072_7196 [Dactylellina haptotyla CBS 200.50]|uniref:L-ornithine N(5)-oxygenase n=1 Tax=Dactylellina haptotyla (strain CBS 200.50) TaxID=1284197 RepID=S8A7P1_DACHA|nr:hypothetical protein H072_7196 [Dactylellina haptotyla CBS 200.50]